jgi:hypothetical protein
VLLEETVNDACTTNDLSANSRCNRKAFGCTCCDINPTLKLERSKDGLVAGVWERFLEKANYDRQGFNPTVSPLGFISLLNPLIQRLQNPRVDRGDHVHRRIQLFFGHTCFPCVRKAAIHSRIAEPHHCDGKTAAGA